MQNLVIECLVPTRRGKSSTWPLHSVGTWLHRLLADEFGLDPEAVEARLVSGEHDLFGRPLDLQTRFQLTTSGCVAYDTTGMQVVFPPLQTVLRIFPRSP